MTTLTEKQLSQVIEQLSELDNDETINIYNDYAESNSYELIYNNDEMTLNEVFDSPYDAINRTNNFLYKDSEDYFTFNGYGHAISFDYRLSENSPIDIEELAQWLLNEDILDRYNITVTILDSMLASIEDNITDDENMLNKLVIFLEIDIMSDYVYSPSDCMDILYDYDYNQLNDIITHLGINYE